VKSVIGYILFALGITLIILGFFRLDTLNAEFSIQFFKQIGFWMILVGIILAINSWSRIVGNRRDRK